MPCSTIATTTQHCLLATMAAHGLALVRHTWSVCAAHLLWQCRLVETAPESIHLAFALHGLMQPAHITIGHTCTLSTCTHSMACSAEPTSWVIPNSLSVTPSAVPVSMQLSCKRNHSAITAHPSASPQARRQDICTFHKPIQADEPLLADISANMYMSAGALDPLNRAPPSHPAKPIAAACTSQLQALRSCMMHLQLQAMRQVRLA